MRWLLRVDACTCLVYHLIKREIRATPKPMTTTLKLSREQVLCLLDSLEGQHTHLLNADELATHDQMFQRLERALDRLEA